MEALKTILEFQIFQFAGHSLTVFELVNVFIIFIITRFFLWLIKKALNRKGKFNQLDQGSLFALFQLIKYIVWIIALALMFEAIGIEVTLLLAGSAALLVGVGLGLQQTFNDVLSGIILLFEQSVKVGDILDIDGDVVKIQEIGLRASKGLTRTDISIMIPNSMITNSKVVNWSHQTKKTIFTIDVGVAYGSDVDLVVKILEESAAAHPDVLKKGVIQARFTNFGNSSLDFQVLFCSVKIFLIEKIKSDIRITINKKFIENNVTIPFPQMDVHIKSKEK